jgi:adenosylcobinamide kinase/adenosylcobinamide-phosphate guanylyltransferase
MRHALVLGGARSGKTAFAERLALRSGSWPLYLATAEALDPEMRDRVSGDRRFATREEPTQLAQAIIEEGQESDVTLVDSITLWITNLLVASEDVSDAVGELCATLLEFRSAKVILVTHEVGLGVVPENVMARTFRDLAGAAHQRLAEVCDDVYFVAAGLPFTLKGEPPMMAA